MILGEPNGKPATSGIGGRATLDDLFRRAADRHPDAIALIDPPNRISFTDFPARSLTYAQADHVISAIAGRPKPPKSHAILHGPKVSYQRCHIRNWGAFLGPHATRD